MSHAAYITRRRAFDSPGPPEIFATANRFQYDRLAAVLGRGVAVESLLCLLLWPLVVALVSQRSIVHAISGDERGEILSANPTRRSGADPSGLGGQYAYLYDMRVVLAAQALAAVACIAAWVAVNVLLKLYG
jgi:hypothetical protein